MGLDLNEAEFLFHCDSLACARLLVHQFSGRESLSQPFEFVIDVVCDDANLDLDAPIGGAACLTLRGRLSDGARYTRCVHGVIERFVQVGAGHRQSRYQATLVPTLKPLAFTRNSRIFQKTSAPSVTQRVLADARVPSDWVSALLHGKYGERDYCVQYQESDLDFISRLWEEEGIFYFFEHEKDKDTLVLGDGKHAFPTLPVYAEAQLRDIPHLHEECLFEFRAESVLRPGATVLRDFKFKQPTLDLEASAQASQFTEYKMYFFPGEYVDPTIGNQYAKLRLEELQCLKNRYVGAGSVRAMLPGYKFSLCGHRREDCNQEFLIVSVEHRGTQPQALAEEGHAKQRASYENRVECISAKVPFRPLRNTKRPAITGVQTALVVGPAGEEIHCDDHGRVKVKFHWDRSPGRDDNSSCWIRVSQPWGGAGQGGVFIPRVGQEVVVQFLEGDPDRPLIVGRVYNGENPVPHGLPAAKNISTIRSASTPGGGGYNEIKFDDSKGKELLHIHAQRDLDEVVEHDHRTLVHADQTNTVDGNQTETVTKNQKLTVTKGDQTITVQTGKRDTTIQQADTLTVHASQTLQVDKQRQHTVGLGETIHIGASQSTTVGASQSTTVEASQSTTVGGTRTVNVAMAATENVGLAKALSVGAGYAVQVGAAHMLTVGGAMMKNVGTVLLESVGLLHRITAGMKWQLGVGAAKVILRKSGKILLEGSTSKITMEAGKVKIESGAGASIELDGTKIKISAAEVEINGSAKVDVKGAVINSEASGVQTLKGTPVKINC